MNMENSENVALSTAADVEIRSRARAAEEVRRGVLSLPLEAEPPQRLVLCDVPWETYEQLFDALEEQPLRMTYYRGALEIMPISRRHERVKKLTAQLVERLSEELGIPIDSAGATTQKRRPAKGALEPDESYYVANEPVVRHKDELDFDRDPPPDLALEVDITSSSLDRMAIYAAMKVPELWRYDHVNDEMLFYVLDEQGTYQRTEYSRSFPLLSAAVLTGFLRLRHSKNRLEIIRSFVEWAREEIAKQLATRKQRKAKRPRT